MKFKRLKKDENFSEWYDQILDYCEICDSRYPVKGVYVYRWYGFKMFLNIMRYLEKLLEESDHKPFWFPLFITEEIFRKEAEHIKGFFGEVFKVTKAGNKVLDKELIVRPTSETEIYYMASLWIKSHRDLPLKIYMTNTVYRYETKATRPLIRVREILWNEAHTLHSSEEDALKQVEEAIKIYEKLYEFMGIKKAYYVLLRPEFDKFHGAEFSIAFDGVMPNGKRIQIGTVHYLGQKFSKAFGVVFLNEKEEKEYAYQTCYGVSIRALAYMLSVLGDERGLRLPPSVSPIKIVIVPIWYSEEEKIEVLEFCKKIKKILDKSFREGLLFRFLKEWNQNWNPNIVFLDENPEKKPVEKFYHWEILGVPIRVEVGKKDINENVITIFRRDLMKKEKYSLEEIEEVIFSLIKDMQKNFEQISEKYIKDKVIDIKSFNEVSSKENKIYRGFVCENCYSKEKNNELKEKYNFEFFGIEYNSKGNLKGKCIFCGKETNNIVYFGKSY